jgi:hypothetical protein
MPSNTAVMDIIGFRKTTLRKVLAADYLIDAEEIVMNSIAQLRSTNTSNYTIREFVDCLTEDFLKIRENDKNFANAVYAVDFLKKFYAPVKILQQYL